MWRAELFLDKYDPGHAEEVLGELLEQAPNDPDALVGLAHVRLDQALDFDEAERLARRALSINPNLPEAYFVLAGIALRDMELETAERHVATGVAVNPRDLPLVSMRAAVRFLAEDSSGFLAEKARVFALNPEYSRFFAIVGEHADWEHRYDEIVAMMQEAVKLDPDDALASASLGVNLIRAGREQDGVGALSKAFSLDPYNVRVFNTLNLFDKVIPKSYVSVPGARFTIRYHDADKAVLERYVPRWLEAAWTEMVSHYGFTPTTPIGVELYAERENFAIRTSGLPETAIQGVCFGKTLASMSPQNETFNLGMTLWHELAHVFHIQMSRSRVPRWFTEGLAEYETLIARPEWAREHDPDLFDMQRAGRLPSLGRMSRAFTRAEELSDVATAYYASSQIVTDLGKQYGMPKLSEMLRGWGQGLSTEEVFKRVLGETTVQADQRFAKELEQRFGRYRAQFVPLSRAPNLRAARDGVEAQPKDAGAQIKLAIAAFRAGEIEEARYALENAKKLDPKQRDARYLDAKLLFAGKKSREAVRALRALAADGADGYDVQMSLAQAARAAGDQVALRESLEAARKFDPTQTDPLYGLLELNAQGGSPERELELVERAQPPRRARRGHPPSTAADAGRARAMVRRREGRSDGDLRRRDGPRDAPALRAGARRRGRQGSGSVRGRERDSMPRRAARAGRGLRLLRRALALVRQARQGARRRAASEGARSFERPTASAGSSEITPEGPGARTDRRRLLSRPFLPPRAHPREIRGAASAGTVDAERTVGGNVGTAHLCRAPDPRSRCISRPGGDAPGGTPGLDRGRRRGDEDRSPRLRRLSTRAARRGHAGDPLHHGNARPHRAGAGGPGRAPGALGRRAAGYRHRLSGADPTTTGRSARWCSRWSTSRRSTRWIPHFGPLS